MAWKQPRNKSSQVIREVYMYVYIFFVNHSTPFFGYMLVFSVENNSAFNR